MLALGARSQEPEALQGAAKENSFYYNERTAMQTNLLRTGNSGFWLLASVVKRHG